MIRIRCSNCGEQEFADILAGMRVKCHGCSNWLDLPQRVSAQMTADAQVVNPSQQSPPQEVSSLIDRLRFLKDLPAPKDPADDARKRPLVSAAPITEETLKRLPKWARDQIAWSETISPAPRHPLLGYVCSSCLRGIDTTERAKQSIKCEKCGRCYCQICNPNPEVFAEMLINPVLDDCPECRDLDPNRKIRFG